MTVCKTLRLTIV